MTATSTCTSLRLPLLGGAQFCQQLEALSGGRFRFASASIAARAANDRAQSRLGRLELVRKAVLTDIASLWGKEEQVSDAVRLKFDTDLCEFDQLQQLEEMARPKNGAPRFRILEAVYLMRVSPRSRPAIASHS